MIVGLGAGVAVSIGNAWVSVMGAVGTGIATTPNRWPPEEPAITDDADIKTTLATKTKLAMKRMTQRMMETRGSRMELG
jgi:hypothetical protein